MEALVPINEAERVVRRGTELLRSEEHEDAKHRRMTVSCVLRQYRNAAESIAPETTAELLGVLVQIGKGELEFQSRGQQRKPSAGVRMKCIEAYFEILGKLQDRSQAAGQTEHRRLNVNMDLVGDDARRVVDELVEQRLAAMSEGRATTVVSVSSPAGG